MEYDIKEMVKGDKKVHFLFYRQKELWYETDTGFKFPVPIDDCGEAAFLVEDRAMLFMRYIRKHIAALKADAEEKPTLPMRTIDGAAVEVTNAPSELVAAAPSPFETGNYIGVNVTITSDGATFNLDVNGHVVPISSTDANKITVAEVIERAFKASDQ